MSLVLTALLGYLLGGLPTADRIAATRGLDLRSAGSGNPGANNARRLGGTRLAIAVLGAEVAKGVVVVTVASALAHDPGIVVGSIGAVAGNVLNPYRGFRGGQGLGLSAGLLAAGAPTLAAVGVTVVVLTVAATRSSRLAALSALVAITGTAAVAHRAPWGIEPTDLRLVLAVGLTGVVAPKQVAALLRESGRRRPRSPA